jgi:hypothetical protein
MVVLGEAVSGYGKVGRTPSTPLPQTTNTPHYPLGL